jgi:hypothetical protein
MAVLMAPRQAWRNLKKFGWRLTPPHPLHGSFEEGKRKEGKELIVPGKTKSEEAVVVSRVVEVAVRRTHPPRSEVPRTPAKGIFTGRIRTLLLAA